MDQGMIQVYYGSGEGKTSAALGQAIRLAGRGGTVYVIPFLKGQVKTEYISRLEPELKFFRFEKSPEAYDDMNEEERAEEKQNLRNGISFARKVLATGECDLLVLDEVLGAIYEGMFDEEELVSILSQRNSSTSVILTGRFLPESIRDVADHVLNINREK